MVSCLSEIFQWLIIAYIVIKWRLLSMTYKAPHLWSQFNFNPIFPLLSYPAASVYFIYNIIYNNIMFIAPWTFFVILSWVFFLSMLVFPLRIFFFLYNPVPYSNFLLILQTQFWCHLSPSSKVGLKCSRFCLPLYLDVHSSDNPSNLLLKLKLVFFHRQDSLWVWLNHLCAAFMLMKYIAETCVLCLQHRIQK